MSARRKQRHKQGGGSGGGRRGSVLATGFLKKGSVCTLAADGRGGVRGGYANDSSRMKLVNQVESKEI